MALSNSERIGKGLELLRDGLVPFVEREMKSKYADEWIDQVLQSTPKEQDWIDKDGHVQWDAHRVLLVLWNQWNTVFKKTLGQSERTYVSELREIRNRWAHQNAFTYDDTEPRALSSLKNHLIELLGTLFFSLIHCFSMI
jgi:hypothetical protein